MRSPGPAVRMCPRLLAIAELVVPGRVLADIGTDHALLPAALVLRGTVPRALACDRAADPLVRARATIDRHGLADRIALRRGEGLAALADDDEVATVVIAGMGAGTLLAILAADPTRVRGCRRLVLQPNHGHGQVRRWLVDHDFSVVDERLTEDRERFYTVIAAEPGRAAAAGWSRVAWAVGPVVLRRGGPVLERWAAAELRRCDRADRRTPGLTMVAERRALVAEALAQARALAHPGPA